MYAVYVIVNTDNNIYIGQTNNLERRLSEHNSANNHFTNNRGVRRIIYKERIPNRRLAIIREKQLKSSRGRDRIRTEILGRTSVS
ncbi:MAG: GIY-YIG nuclease family protein [bacterium]|nr:GIY-YIG nuclease family protein [bacterium]